jgi:multidrug efflux pump
MDHHDTAAAGGSRFNVSRWALDHPALTRYLLVVLMVLGVAAYFQLGQDEDPPFTFRAMVVTGLLARRQRAADGRPGHRQDREDTAGGAVCRQDPQLHPAGRVLHHPAGEGLDATARGGQQLLPGTQAHRRHAQHAAGRGHRAGFNDDFGDVFGSIYALSADGFSPEELRQHAERVRERCCGCPTWPRCSCTGCRPSGCSSRSRRSGWRSWAWT